MSVFFTFTYPLTAGVVRTTHCDFPTSFLHFFFPVLHCPLRLGELYSLMLCSSGGRLRVYKAQTQLRIQSLPQPALRWQQPREFLAGGLTCWTVLPVARVRLLVETGWRTFSVLPSRPSCTLIGARLAVVCTARAKTTALMADCHVHLLMRKGREASGMGTHRQDTMEAE